MSWKFIFNSRVGKVWWSTFDNASKKAKESGYMFLEWNYAIMTVDGQDTGLTVEDCY